MLLLGPGRVQTAASGAQSRAGSVAATAAAVMVLVVVAAALLLVTVAVVAAVADAAIGVADRCVPVCLAHPSTPGIRYISGLQVIGGVASIILVPAVGAVAVVAEEVGWLVEEVGQASAAAAAEILQDAVAAYCHVCRQVAGRPLHN